MRFRQIGTDEELRARAEVRLLPALRAPSFLASMVKIENPAEGSRRVGGWLESHDDGSGAVDAGERPSVLFFGDRFA